MGANVLVIITLLTAALILKGYVVGLKNVKLGAAEAIKAGDSLLLVCDYDLENALLYSVKWYFGDNEFYRYVPKESPPTREFPLPGITVDVSKSNDHQVVLRDVGRNMSGIYSCEVSADAPLFHTDIKTTYVTVIEEPKMVPVVNAGKMKYSNTENIRVNCSSYRGYPAANLTWYINGYKVNPTDSSVKILNSVFQEINGLETSRSTLVLASSFGFFQDGTLHIRCEARQYNIYRRSSDIKLLEDTPQLARVLSPSSEKNYGDRNKLQKILPILLIFVIRFVYF